MSYPAPTAPDMERCFTYFNDPARLTDCNTAFNLLPDGPQPITWNNHHAQQSDPYALPFSIVHGSCEIIFQTSGPAAQELITFQLPGVEVRKMAGRVMGHCIEKGGVEGHGGGFVTRDFKSLLQSITFPGTPFFEHFPVSSTFLTVLVWNRYGHVHQGNFAYNPGNQDLIIAEVIDEQLYRAQKRWPRGSASRGELVMRQNAVAAALPALEDLSMMLKCATAECHHLPLQAENSEYCLDKRDLRYLDGWLNMDLELPSAQTERPASLIANFQARRDAFQPVPPAVQQQTGKTNKSEELAQLKGVNSKGTGVRIEFTRSAWRQDLHQVAYHPAEQTFSVALGTRGGTTVGLETSNGQERTGVGGKGGKRALSRCFISTLPPFLPLALPWVSQSL
ncbi:MAG: hypothetical protein Q9180_001250 [Flavoplaca navasiana]